MAFEINGQSFTAEASADLSTHQYKAVEIGALGQVALQSTALVPIAGVLQNNPNAAGQAATVKFAGVTKAVAGATVTVGAVAEVGATGLFIDRALTTTYAVGIFLRGGAINEVVPLLLL